MSGQFIRNSIGQGIHLSAVRDAKFKHNRLSANFILPLTKETASDNGLVPLVLRKGFRECPDFTSLNARLAELYGAALDADVTKYGGWQILALSIKGLDNRFALENEDITGQCADLLASLVLDPKLDGGGLFDAQDVALERQYLLDTIEAEINDKRAYAMNRCVQVMCADEPVSVRRYGDRDTAAAVTTASAAAAYRRMIQTAPAEILFVGSGDSGSASRVFADRFARQERTPVENARARLRTEAVGVKEETERMELSQSKLVMGLRTGVIDGPRDISARRVFAALFGGSPFSKLFLNVRERLGLCYYCASRFDVSTGLLFVDSGVDAANKQKAQDEILRQLEAIQKGDFDDTQLGNTKLLMKNSITTTGDTLSGLEGWYLAQILRGQSVSPEEDARNIDEITREEVIAAANSVTLDTIYFLTGNGEGK